jgi:hypothetical protein
MNTYGESILFLAVLAEQAKFSVRSNLKRHNRIR